MMTFVITAISAFFLGYIYGHKIRPNQRLRKALKDVLEKCASVLQEGNKGLYKTVVTDNNKSSELQVEVKELAVTKNGLVKVQYLNAFYKNPDFRTKKGEALLAEVQGLLGDYLPVDEIEWYENSERHSAIKNYVTYVNTTYNKQSGI